MSAWRSPLLFLGIAIILLAAAAAIAPHVINWNSYRARIADWGGRLTGRAVTIRGDVSVSLFPWPTIVLHDVAVANPPGARQPHLLETEAITARLSLAALVSGRLEVEKVAFRRPTISLERLADGTGSWHLRPATRVHLPFSPERIAIAGITLEDGTIFLIDARRGGEARFTHVNARISAPRLLGPWKLKAEADLQGQPISLTVTTGRLAANGPVRISVRLAPRGEGGFVYAFDGRLRDPEPGRISGRLHIRPRPAEGKENMADGLALYAFSADVIADFDEIWLKKLEAAPLSAARSANTVKGEAHIVLGGILEVEASLKAGRFDLDWLLGADSRRFFGGEGLIAISDLIAGLPPELLLRLDVSVSSLTVGGESLQGVHASVDASAEQLAVNTLSTTLPGGSRLAFTGQLVPTTDQPQLSGSVEFESRALRDFVLWAAPARADALGRLWTGARGRLKLDTRIDATPERLRLFDGTFMLDEARGQLRLSLAPARLHVEIGADILDIDRYAPSGLAAETGSGTPAQALLEIIAAAMQFGDVAVDLKANRMNLWGLPMQGVGVAFVVNEDRAEIRRFDIASLKGARIGARGRLTFPEDGIEGRLETTVTAGDVTPLWLLLAGHRSDANGDKAAMPAWLQGLGKLDLTLSATARSLDPGAAVTMRLKGRAGPLDIDAEGRFAGRLSRWRQADVTAKARLQSPRSRPLLALLLGTALTETGNDGPTGRPELPASLDLSLKGSAAAGLETRLQLSLAGLDAAYMGTVRDVSPQAGPSGEGRMALRTARLARVLALLGYGRPPALPSTMWTEGNLAFSSRRAVWRNVKGGLGKAALAGELTLRAPEPGADPAIEPRAARWRLEGRITGDRLNLPTLAFVWLTAGKGAEAPFRPGIFGGPDLSLSLETDALSALPGLVLHRGHVTIDRNPRQGVKVRIAAGHPPSAALRPGAPLPATDGMVADIRLRPARTGILTESKVTASLDLASLLRRMEGRPLIESRMWMRLSGRAAGRSLAALARAFAGDGSLHLAAGRFPAMDVGAFLEAAAHLSESARLDEVLRTSLDGGALPFPGATTSLRVQAGVLSTAPVTWKAEGFEIRAGVFAELATGRFDVTLRFTPGQARRPKSERPPPPFALTFAGPSDALELVPQIDELRDWVSVTALTRSMAELERVERERRRVLEEESAFERRQVMFERWRAWAEEKARREAAFRARVDRLLVRTDASRRRAARHIRATLRREEARRRVRPSQRRSPPAPPAPTGRGSKDQGHTPATRSSAPSPAAPPQAQTPPSDTAVGTVTDIQAVLEALRATSPVTPPASDGKTSAEEKAKQPRRSEPPAPPMPRYRPTGKTPPAARRAPMRIAPLPPPESGSEPQPPTRPKRPRTITNFNNR